MKAVKTDEHALERLHNEWIGSLLAYEEELRSIHAVGCQMQTSVNDLHFQRELREIRNEIVMQKGVISELTDEVMDHREKFINRDGEQAITLAELIENNRFREKILHAEQAVFMLKYHVNKLLSIAS